MAKSIKKWFSKLGVACTEPWPNHIFPTSVLELTNSYGWMAVKYLLPASKILCKPKTRREAFIEAYSFWNSYHPTVQCKWKKLTCKKGCLSVFFLSRPVAWTLPSYFWAQLKHVGQYHQCIVKFKWQHLFRYRDLNVVAYHCRKPQAQMRSMCTTQRPACAYSLYKCFQLHSAFPGLFKSWKGLRMDMRWDEMRWRITR